MRRLYDKISDQPAMQTRGSHPRKRATGELSSKDLTAADDSFMRWFRHQHSYEHYDGAMVFAFLGGYRAGLRASKPCKTYPQCACASMMLRSGSVCAGGKK